LLLFETDRFNHFPTIALIKPERLTPWLFFG
jgi:hypothetical protein